MCQYGCHSSLLISLLFCCCCIALVFIFVHSLKLYMRKLSWWTVFFKYAILREIYFSNVMLFLFYTLLFIIKSDTEKQFWVYIRTMTIRKSNSTKYRFYDWSEGPLNRALLNDIMFVLCWIKMYDTTNIEGFQHMCLHVNKTRLLPHDFKIVRLSEARWKKLHLKSSVTSFFLSLKFPSLYHSIITNIIMMAAPQKNLFMKKSTSTSVDKEETEKQVFMYVFVEEIKLHCKSDNFFK